MKNLRQAKLDKIPIQDYIPIISLARGAFMRRRDSGTDRRRAPEMWRASPVSAVRQFRIGLGVAPAGAGRSHASGTPRVTVRPYYEGPPSMAARGPDEGGRKPAGSGTAEAGRPVTEARSRGEKSPPNEPRLRKLVWVWRAGRRRFAGHREAQIRNARAFRRAIPPHSLERRPRVSKNRGDDARRHSGAPRSGEPGIHNPDLRLWIPALAAMRLGRND